MKLSSKKAKSVLEFMCKKKIGATSCRARLHPYSQVNGNTRYCVMFYIEFSDGKGYIAPLLEMYTMPLSLGRSLCPMLLSKQFSWSKILRCIEDKSRHSSSFLVSEGSVLFNSSDTIEKKIIEMDLENEL